MSAVIVSINSKKQERKCSFCGTFESKAKKFITSNVTNHCICGDCIVKAKKVSDETVIEVEEVVS